MGGREDFRSPRGASSRGVKALQISKKLSSGQKKTLERNEGLEGRNGRPSRSVGSSVPYPDLAQKVMRVETGRTRQSFPGDGRGLNHFQVAKRAGSGKKRRASSAGEDATRTPPTSHERPKRQKQHLSISARSEKLMEQPSADPMPSTSGRGQKITTANFYGASAGRNKRKATVPKRDETRSFQPARSFHRLRRRDSTSDDEDDEDVNHGRNRRRERSRTAAKRSNPPPEPILIEVISDGEDEDENEDSRGNAGDASEPVTIASPGTRQSARIREKKGATGTAKLAAMIGKKNVNCMWRSKYTKGRSISISERDLDSLGDNEFLNDTVIDFYISHLLDKMQEETGSKTPGHGGRGAKRASVTSDDIFVFSTFFYRKLINSASSLDKLDKWCRDEDLFAKKYLFVPVCANYHWSLVLISNNLVYSVDNGNKLDDVATTIIHIDSMYAGHSTNNINKNLRKFLDHVWRRSTAIETSICHKVALESSMYERGEKAFNAATILGGRMKSPRQNNYSDCGLFLLKFLEKFLRRPPTSVHGTKVDHNGNKSLGGKFRVDHNGKDEKFGTRDWFRPGDAHELRKFLRHKIMNMILDEHQTKIRGLAGKMALDDQNQGEGKGGDQEKNGDELSESQSKDAASEGEEEKENQEGFVDQAQAQAPEENLAARKPQVTLVPSGGALVRSGGALSKILSRAMLQQDKNKWKKKLEGELLRGQPSEEEEEEAEKSKSESESENDKGFHLQANNLSETSEISVPGGDTNDGEDKPEEREIKAKSSPAQYLPNWHIPDVFRGKFK